MTEAEKGMVSHLNAKLRARCVCMFDENGDGPIIVCAAHKLWLENEREACAKIADMQALTSDDEVRQETAEIIAGAIRSRFTNGGSLT